MPALDIHMIESLSRELHPTSDLMSETEVSHTIPSFVCLFVWVVGSCPLNIIPICVIQESEILQYWVKQNKNKRLANKTKHYYYGPVS